MRGKPVRANLCVRPPAQRLPFSEGRHVGLPLRRRKRAGLTLLELMLSLTLLLILGSAVGYGFMASLSLQQLQARRYRAQNLTEGFEKRIRELIEGAKLSASTTDTTTFFLGTQQNQGSDIGCEELTFTTTASSILMSAQNSSDDFETQQRNFGPQGGVAEVSLSMTPIGDAGGRTGLFERLQRPSDGDPTQGGMESLLSGQVDRIGFQFWNGSQWVDTWSTSTGEHRLPAAVRVSYHLSGAAQQAVRVMMVPIAQSDVTAQNPVSNNGQ